jgi:hypothetical protein
LIDRIGKQYQPIGHLMADEIRPGWELLYEDGKSATDDNWAKRLAGNESITMNLELKWKPLQLPPPPGNYTAPQGGPSTSQNTLSPYGVAYLGYGTSSYGGAAMTPSSYNPQNAPQQYIPGQYSTPGYMESSAPLQFPPPPPSTESDVSAKNLPTPKGIENELQELKELIEKTMKLREELENPKPSEELLLQAAELARLENELELQEKADEQKSSKEYQEMMEKANRARLAAESVEEIRRQSLKGFSPVRFTDCLGRYYTIPYGSCMKWLACVHTPIFTSSTNKICRIYRHLSRKRSGNLRGTKPRWWGAITTNLVSMTRLLCHRVGHIWLSPDGL